MRQIKLGNRDILVLIGVFKVLPYGWFKMLNEYLDFDHKSFRASVSYLKKSGYLTMEIDREGMKYLYLTRKGILKVKGFVPIDYTWTRWTRQRTDTIHRDHHMVIFHFLIDYILKFKDEEVLSGSYKGLGDFRGYNIEQIYTDYDGDKCKYQFKYSGYDIDVKPDMILLPTINEEEVVICLEADTGSVTIGKNYNKILRYCMMCHHELKKQGIQKIKLYFSFQSKRRLDTMFKYPKVLKRDGLLYEMFDQGLVQRYQSGKSKAQMTTRELKRVLEEGKLEIYAGVERGGFDGYDRVDLLCII